MENDKYIGRLLGGRYELIDVVGVGGMAVVYRARDTVLGRYVAIKILKEEFAKDPDIRKRFAIESRAVAKLSHHNIVSVYDVGNEDGTDYIVMELIEGVTLKEYLQQKGRLSWQESIFFAEQISSALVHAHSRGIIHQDIKPQNVIILRDGTAKLTDFGIASFATTQETRVVQEAIGSVHYISPEQAKGAWVDDRSDLYSLGVVMYEMLTGRTPYDGETPVSVAIQHINGGAPLPSTLVTGIPRGLEQITMHAMASNADERYSSATEMLRDMEEFRKNPSLTFVYGPGGQTLRQAPQAPQQPQQPQHGGILCRHLTRKIHIVLRRHQRLGQGHLLHRIVLQPYPYPWFGQQVKFDLLHPSPPSDIPDHSRGHSKAPCPQDGRSGLHPAAGSALRAAAATAATLQAICGRLRPAPG